MRRIFFLAMLATVYSVSFAQNNSSKDLYLTKSFSDGAFKKINAETTHGDIAVSVVPASETRIEVYIRSGNSYEELSKEEIKKRLDEYYTMDITLTAEEVRAVVHQKKEFYFNEHPSLRISFMIYTTKSKSTELKTDHGNIEMAGMEGSQKLTTDHGDINAGSISGKLVANTDHGNVNVADSKDDIDVRTDHGDLVLHNLKGKVHAVTDHGNVDGHMIEGTLFASTDHGDVNLKNLTCSVETSTDHGYISLSFEKISGDISAGNSNGDISLQLPKGNGLNLDLRGKDVDMKSSETFSGNMDKEEVKGTLNGGGSKVYARTDRGQVSLTVR
jgi:DUF4097 and DUF4098 domain-containing protein YvlB